jgi:hypothetical protein
VSVFSVLSPFLPLSFSTDAPVATTGRRLRLSSVNSTTVPWVRVAATDPEIEPSTTILMGTGFFGLDDVITVSVGGDLAL